MHYFIHNPCKEWDMFDAFKYDYKNAYSDNSKAFKAKKI